jgi:hypothetical protein
MMETPGGRQRYLSRRLGFGFGLAIGVTSWGSTAQSVGQGPPAGDDRPASLQSDVPPNPLRRPPAATGVAAGPLDGQPSGVELSASASDTRVGPGGERQELMIGVGSERGRSSRGKIVFPPSDRWLMVAGIADESPVSERPLAESQAPARSAAEVTAELIRQTNLPARPSSGSPTPTEPESSGSGVAASSERPALDAQRSPATRVGFQLQDDGEDRSSGRGFSANPELTAAQQRLKLPLQRTLAYYLANPESTAARSPWAVMHAALPFSADAELIAGNRRVNAIGWLCQNGQLRGQRIFNPARSGFVVNVGPGVQGHEGQLLAILAQCRIAEDFPIRVGSFQGSVADVVRYEMLGCRPRTELTFRLIGLSHYLPADESWLSDDRQRWSIERLVQEELAQPIVGAACGGTHRLMGLTYALRKRQEAGLPIDGHFSRAAQFIDDFVDYAWTLQNPDGSFSTNWFESRGNQPDAKRKVQTTGHVAEWLVFTLPDDQLADPRLVRSLELLVSQLYDRRDQDWPIGPRGHAIRALALYEQRVYGGRLGERHQQLARLIEQSQPRR